jgi:EAL domain-containing protein (putative c-di-GMP-specific phosphodiesterase class I)
VPTLLSAILAPGAISTVFQPIYQIDDAIPAPVIFECLSRGPVATNAAHAGVLFEYAQLKAAEVLVDRACISAALSILPTIRRPGRFSLNVFAATLTRDTDFTRWLAEQLSQFNLDPADLIFEIVEHGEASDSDAFLHSLREIRALGATIALDDVGLAHSNLRRIIDCHPEFLKLDQCLVRNCNQDNRRQALLRSLASLSKELGSTLIAEGVETQAEMDYVRSCDIRLLQGFLLSRPLPAPDISRLMDGFSVRKSHTKGESIGASAI